MTQPRTGHIGGTGMSENSARPGNHGAWMLRRNDGDRSEIITFSLEIPGRHPGIPGDDIHQAVRRQLPSVAARDRPLIRPR